MKKSLRNYQETATTEMLKHCFECWKTGSLQNIVLEASVGSGKTLMLAHMAKFISDRIADKGGRVLVLADQGELIEQNSQEAWEYGLKNSVFANSLNSKSVTYPVIFGMRQTIINYLDKEFADMRVAIMLVDEVHKWNFEDDESQAYKVYSHFKKINPNLIVVGVTGTPYRGVDHIVGKGRFFEAQTKNPISTQYLTDQGWLVDRNFGIEMHDQESIDFSDLKLRENNESGGNYSEEEIDFIYQGKSETTFNICQEIVKNTYAPEELGVLIFCGSKFHTKQVKYGLEKLGVKPEEIAIVTDDTSDTDRTKARLGAISGKIKYFLNVSVASTGWNVPRWKHVIYLKPVGSIVFFYQSIGRVLRPFLAHDQIGLFNDDNTSIEERKAILAASDKPYSVVHDYAGVMEKLAPYLDADPVAAEALAEKAKKEKQTKPCPRCNFENSEFAQRCSNVINDQRCLHFWQSVPCLDTSCKDEEGEPTQNSPMSQQCRICAKILKDPNKALLNKMYSDSELREVDSMTLDLSNNGSGVLVRYKLRFPDAALGEPWLYFHLDKKEYNRANWFNNFVKPHCKDAGWQGKIRNMSAQNIVKMSAMFDKPTHITVRKNDSNKFIIAKKLFLSGREETA